jgi:hypothetical protein
MIARLMSLVAPNADHFGPYIFFAPQLLLGGHCSSYVTLPYGAQTGT